MDSFTTLRISKKNWERLNSLGRKNETFDEIIERILNFYDDKNDE